MPRTPSVARPIARASFSEKRIAWPFRETSRMSSPGEQSRTATSSSPSRILIAMIPSALSGVLYSASFVFLTTPFFVAQSRNSVSPKSRVWMTARTFSSWRIGSRLVIARPFDCRDPSGSSCTFSR